MARLAPDPHGLRATRLVWLLTSFAILAGLTTGAVLRVSLQRVREQGQIQRRLESEMKRAAKEHEFEDAARYRKIAEEFAGKWSGLAAEGDHYKLAFDKAGTWSQKYNLVWDKLLGLNLFPQSLTRKETSFYSTHANDYGLPLDNRAAYTKIDWLAWTATLAGSKQGFEAFFAPAYHFADASPSRVPLTDWYDTMTGKQVGFQARSVVGGIFIRMLDDPATWKKWSAAPQ